MNTKLLILVGTAIIILAGAAYFGLSKKSSIPTPAPTQETTQTQPTSSTTSTTPSSIPSGEATKVKEVKITLNANGFSPASVTIDKGTKVVWTNKSGEDATINSDPHPVHTDYPPLNLNGFSDGETLELVFNDPGTYGYHNHLNAGERGKIIVK